MNLCYKLFSEMAQIQLNDPPPPQETSQSDQTSLLEETRPPDHSLSLRSDEQPSVTLTPDSPGHSASPSPSLSTSHPDPDPEDEDEVEDEGIPEHEFEIKTTEGKFGKMKGVAREKVSLLLGNYIFRKRRQLKNGSGSKALSLGNRKDH